MSGDRVASYGTGVRVLRWTSGVALVLWLATVLLVAWTTWDATGQMGVGVDPVSFGEPPALSSFERVRLALTSSLQAGALLLLTFVVAYALAIHYMRQADADAAA